MIVCLNDYYVIYYNITMQSAIQNESSFLNVTLDAKYILFCDECKRIFEAVKLVEHNFNGGKDDIILGVYLCVKCPVDHLIPIYAKETPDRMMCTNVIKVPQNYRTT